MSKQMFYKCPYKKLVPPKNFLTLNFDPSEYKNEVWVDECLADEIEDLWSKGIKTTGCCCGHGVDLGFIEVTDECIDKMLKLGYQHYIYPTALGGEKRKDAFIPKTYGHTYDGYHERFRREGKIYWVDCKEQLPFTPGQYLVTYHPCYWDEIDYTQSKVGFDSFRGTKSKSWAKRKYQHVIAWAELPEVFVPYGKLK